MYGIARDAVHDDGKGLLLMEQAFFIRLGTWAGTCRLANADYRLSDRVALGSP